MLNIFKNKNKKIGFDDIEQKLIQSDISYELIEKIMDGLPQQVSQKELNHRLVMLFEHITDETKQTVDKPYVELVFGVNGAGKTTTIAKLSNMYKEGGESVILGAADTFRAAAIEQLDRWATKISVSIIKTKQGHDPSAVAYDTISSAVAKGIDRVIIDTAGRLQTKKNLNKELQKINKVCQKAKVGSPHRKLLIVDGTQGNTAVAQAKDFQDIIGIDGVIITKLDGTAKGGAVFGISNILQLPILYVGYGENENDIKKFNKYDFVDDLTRSIYEQF
ncbi:MAG: signal recognition particle-docking protein FtsY [Epsilonproteobacteria bacterium]|nr:MAG: signal recognition particle-docking protein FtsY [Campylobacterota bacterium]